MLHEGQGNQKGENAGRNRDAPRDDDPQGHPGYRLEITDKENKRDRSAQTGSLLLAGAHITDALILEVVFLNHSPLGV